MGNVNLIPIFVVGLLGSVHCVGMCGGIVSAFSSLSTAPNFPVRVAVQGAQSAGIMQFSIADTAIRSLAYNAGRISSYALAGAVAGGIVGSVYTFSKISQLQIAGFWLANLMLIALGLYLMDTWRGLARLEKTGQGIWKHVQPLMKRILSVDTPAKMFLLGSLWGWVPCGMVYSVLMTAMLTGSALSGASVMLAFGLGTLPMLLAVSMLGMRIQAYLQKRNIRMAGGMIVLAFGIIGLIRLATGISLGWLDILCLAHPGGGL